MENGYQSSSAISTGRVANLELSSSPQIHAAGVATQLQEPQTPSRARRPSHSSSRGSQRRISPNSPKRHRSLTFLSKATGKGATFGIGIKQSFKLDLSKRMKKVKNHFSNLKPPHKVASKLFNVNTGQTRREEVGTPSRPLFDDGSLHESSIEDMLSGHDHPFDADSMRYGRPLTPSIALVQGTTVYGLANDPESGVYLPFGNPWVPNLERPVHRVPSVRIDPLDRTGSLFDPSRSSPTQSIRIDPLECDPSFLCLSLGSTSSGRSNLGSNLSDKSLKKEEGGAGNLDMEENPPRTPLTPITNTDSSSIRRQKSQIKLMKLLGAEAAGAVAKSSAYYD